MNTNSNTPKVSVVMSVYNESDAWLRQAIDSVLSQTFNDFEFIIINDNPENKKNIEILSGYAESDQRVKLILNDKNIGLTKSLNIGLRKAVGKYVARMDADDQSLPDRFATQFAYMESNPDCVVCGSSAYHFNDSGMRSLFSLPTSDEEIKSVLLMKSCIFHPAVFIRCTVFTQQSAYYNENFRYSQDYELFCRLSFYGELHNISAPLINYRISTSQISSKNKTQVLLAYKISYNYFINLLASYGIAATDPQILSKIKSLNVAGFQRKYLLAAYYSSLRLSQCIYKPLLNGDVLELQKLYLSCIKRAVALNN